MHEKGYKRGSRNITAVVPTKQKHRVKRMFVPSAPDGLSSLAKIDWALRSIMKEVKNGNGNYPYGTLNIQEVIRRAGVGRTYLESKGLSKNIENSKVGCKNKIKRVIRILKGKYYYDIVDTNPVTTTLIYQKMAIDIKQKWVEAELEYIEMSNRLKAYEDGA
ncbi:hypothetical protein LJR231_002562 [Phyllobacterium sp. LjRoot231]|uniref:hypothetical protein n=1 Tax=Phyllobacterium sp. LjRoot231 TaxID=3342289 RepID=UPI003ECF97B0